MNHSKTSLWRNILRTNFTNWEKLADFLLLSTDQRKAILPKSHFPLNIPMRLASKIQKGTLEDPLLKQFLPTAAEKTNNPLFVQDPVGDNQARKGAKLLHKYQGRVLLVTTSACAMHCRYCFRQNFDYDVKEKGFDTELSMIASDPSIHEVILSGGDPLSLADTTLKSLLGHIDSIPHVRRIRFHSRFPMGLPERIDDTFLNILKELRCQIWFVIHANHPREFDDDIFSSLRALQKMGVVVLNQAVLLKGVNDNIAVLKDLCQTAVDHGIFPYYLHQLDRVQGAEHFEVDKAKGLELIKQLSTLLPGYAIPKYVCEIAGEASKTYVHSAS